MPRRSCGSVADCPMDEQPVQGDNKAMNSQTTNPNAAHPVSARSSAISVDRVPIYKAAKAVHRSPAFVMEFVNSGLLRAWRTGGSATRPWLTVNLSELLAVIDRETLYVPPALKYRRQPKPRPTRAELHPLAAAI